MASCATLDPWVNTAPQSRTSVSKGNRFNVDTMNSVSCSSGRRRSSCVRGGAVQGGSDAAGARGPGRAPAGRGPPSAAHHHRACRLPQRLQVPHPLHCAACLWFARSIHRVCRLVKITSWLVPCQFCRRAVRVQPLSWVTRHRRCSQIVCRPGRLSRSRISFDMGWPKSFESEPVPT